MCALKIASEEHMVALQKVTWVSQVDRHSPKNEGHRDCTLTSQYVCVCERDAAGRVKVRTEKEGDALGSRVVGGYKVSHGENQSSSDPNCGRQTSGRKSLTKQDYKTKAGSKVEGCVLWEKCGPTERIRAELETEKVPGGVGLNMETEEQNENSLRTVALILLCCGAVKMLHLLGVISVEGECAQLSSASRCVLSAAWQESETKCSPGGVQGTRQ